MKLVKTSVCEPNRLYIEDFCDDLNYRSVILYIGNVDAGRLRAAIQKDHVNKLWRFDNAVNMNELSLKNFIYIENCDMQDLSASVYHYIEEGYDVYVLYEDTAGNYYVKQKLY